MTESQPGSDDSRGASLRGKTALITGSTRGLGRTMAGRLAASGATIVVSGREQQDVDGTVSEIVASGGSALGFAADLKDPAAAHRLAGQSLAAVGVLDMLINNAGMSIRGPFWAVTDEEWDEQVTINTRAPFILAQHAARNMIGHRTPGRIVNVSTIGVQRCHTDACVYDSAKGAIEVMTRNLAYELAPYGISVNCVAPGAVPIRPGSSFDGVDRQNYLRHVPFGRFGNADDIAAAVMYFCAPETAFTTGQTLLVDGAHATWLPVF